MSVCMAYDVRFLDTMFGLGSLLLEHVEESQIDEGVWFGPSKPMQQRGC